MFCGEGPGFSIGLSNFWSAKLVKKQPDTSTTTTHGGYDAWSRATRYRAAIVNPGAWARNPPFYEEHEGDVGPPLGDTGSSLGVNYMGAPKIDSFNLKLFFAKRADNGDDSQTTAGWGARRFDFSLGKLLRLDIAADDTQTNCSPLIFCSFEKTRTAIRGGKLQNKVSELTTHRSTEVRSLGFGAFLELCHPERPNSSSRNSVASSSSMTIVETLLVRLCEAHDRMWQLKTDTVECLRVQLFIDCMLDLSYYIQRTGKYTDQELEDEEPSAFHLFYPHGRRFVHGGELPSLIPSLVFTSLWHEIRPTGKDVVSVLIHLFGCKTAHHRCQIRNLVKIIYDDTNPESDSKKTYGDSRVTGLLKDCILVSLMGNFYTCGYRPIFSVRMHILQSCRDFFRPSETMGASPPVESLRENWHRAIWWFQENTYLLRACMKEYYLYNISYHPAARSVLMASHNHADHEEFVFRSMDVARRMLDSQGPEVFSCPVRLSALMESIQKEHEHAHKNALEFLTKLRKGSFVRVLRNKIKTWLEGKEGVRAAAQALLVHVEEEQEARRQAGEGEDEILRQLHERLLRMIKTANPRVKEKPRVQKERREIMATIIQSLNAIASSPLSSSVSALDINVSPRARLLVRYLAMGVYRDKNRLRWPVDYPQTEEADFVELLDLVAERASQNKRSWFEIDWLLLLGVTREGLDHFRKLYYCYEMEDIPDNRIANEFPLFFQRNIRDLALIFVFLDKIVSIRRTEIRHLDARVMANQVEAARMRYKIPPWCPTPVDITTKRHCNGCGTWADVVVTPDSPLSSVYATGLHAASFDAMTGELCCKKAMTPACKKALISIDLRGKAILISAVKRPPKWYTLCATCGALTVLANERIDYRGPNCGMHPVSVPPTYRDDISLRALEIQDSNPHLPEYMRVLRDARVEMCVEEQHPPEKEFKCAYCSTQGPLVNMHVVLVLDDRCPPEDNNDDDIKQETGQPPPSHLQEPAGHYPRVEMVLCRQDFNRIKRILDWRPSTIDTDSTTRSIKSESVGGNPRATEGKFKPQLLANQRASRPRRSYILYTEVLELIDAIRKRHLYKNRRGGLGRSIPEHRYFEQG